MKKSYYFKTKLSATAIIMMLFTYGVQGQHRFGGGLPCPEINSISATPSGVCSGGSSQLQVDIQKTYLVTSIDYAPIDMPKSGATVLCADGVVVDSADYHESSDYSDLDDASWSDLPIPFEFNFFGINYTSFGLGTNGSVFLGTGEQVNAGGYTTTRGYHNDFPSSSSAVAPCIAGLYGDLNFTYQGTINYFISGDAPNRILVINYTNGQFWYSADEGPNAEGSLNVQVLLYETSNAIEVHIENSTGDNAAVEGIQDATGTTAYTISGRNNEIWTVDSPDAYRFEPVISTYEWASSPYIEDGSVSNPMATGIMGTTTFYVTVTTGDCTAMDSVTVTQLPVISFEAPTSTICAGSSPITLTASPSGGTFSGTGVTASSFDPTTPGTFSITYTVTDPESTCTGSLSQDFDVADCTGITENAFASDINVYPNPSNGTFTLDIPNANFAEMKISIIDPQGKEVYNSTDRSVSAGYKKQVNMENFAKGIYFVKLSTDKGVKVKKLTLQ